jgi:hypothetical protein
MLSTLWKTKGLLADRADGEYATRLPCKSRMKRYSLAFWEGAVG